MHVFPNPVTNGIFQNTKCAERDGFRREGHNYDYKVISYSSIMNAIGMYYAIK